jgi:hypothetical protein
MWDPVITDDLLEIDVSTGVKSDDTQDAMNQRLQVQAKYSFAPTTTQRKPSRFARYASELKALQAKDR